MNGTQPKVHQKIQYEVSQIQSDLASILEYLLTVAGNKIDPEQRTTMEQQVGQTQQLLERLKYQYHLEGVRHDTPSDRIP